jgi:predicted TIM-barrel fold metal-dependent hydrolase
MSQIRDQWLAGCGLPEVLVIDGHIHISEWPHATTFQNVDDAVSQSQRYMDANGVDAICAVSGGYIWGSTDYHLGNDFLLAVWRKMPQRLIPFLGINPNDTRENVLSELRRMYDAGVRCIKLLNYYQNYPGDGPNLMALYEFAAQNRMLVFNHAWSEAEIRLIAERYPETDFIFGHYGGGYQDIVMRAYSNVYTNIWSYGARGWLDRGYKAVGAGKFMMGSDGFLNCLSVGIGPVVYGDLTDNEMRQVLGLTVARLVDKVGALPETVKEKYSSVKDKFDKLADYS